VRATRAWTRSNTNLGIILLLAPLARAALADAVAGGPPHRDDTPTPAALGIPPTPPGADARTDGDATALRARLARVLAASTVADAAALYAAIRLARPGGLGRAPAQDVREAPTVPLAAAMALAADRDGVAREYATAFASSFEVGAPALARARSEGLAWDDAVVETYLALLGAAPDTHLARKLGAAAAADVQRLARETAAAGGVRTPAGRALITSLDEGLRDARNASNPGTTADLTASAIFVHLLSGGWALPEDRSHEHADG
jgi:triphosphoribosyl-dephospho-CoA synthase